MTGWTCPSCERSFRHPNQWHSCVVVGVDDHFAGRPAWLQDAFRRLLEALPDAVRVEPVRTTIHLAATSTFGGVTVRRDRLRVSFLLDHEVDSPRIGKIERLSSGRIGHTVDAGAPSDVDQELIGWLLEAHALRA